MYEIILIEYALAFIIAYSMRKHRNVSWFWGLTAVVFSITLMCFKPYTEMDLYRYYSWLEEYRVEGFEYVVNHYYFRYSPLYPMYFWVISWLPKNELLVGITASLCFGLLFYVLKRYKKQFGFSGEAIFWAYISIIIFVDLLSITGIRFILAIVFTTVGISFDFVKEKKKALLLYVLGGLLHASTWIVLGVSVLSIIFKSLFNKKYFLAMVLLVSFLIMGGGLPIGEWMLELYKITNVRFFYSLGYQILSYIERTGATDTTRLLYEIGIVVRLFSLREGLRINKNKEVSCMAYEYMQIPLVIMMIALGMFNVPGVSIRFFTMANIISLPFLWIYMRLWTEKKRVNKYQHSNAYVISEKDRQRQKEISWIILATFAVQFLYLFYYQYSQFGFAFLG